MAASFLIGGDWFGAVELGVLPLCALGSFTQLA